MAQASNLLRLASGIGSRPLAKPRWSSDRLRRATVIISKSYASLPDSTSGSQPPRRNSPTAPTSQASIPPTNPAPSGINLNAPGRVTPPTPAPVSGNATPIVVTKTASEGATNQQASQGATTPPPIDPISKGQATPKPPEPVVPKRPKSRRWGRNLVYLILFSGLSYAGGVWYSLVSDNFHDFFTEYVPFGEEAVLFFEEREFRKRFPNALSAGNKSAASDGAKVTIPSKSGVSWKVAGENEEGSDLARKGPHMSATDSSTSASAASSGTESKAAPQKSSPTTQKPSPKDASTERKSPTDKSAPSSASTSSKPVQSTPSKSGKKSPEVNEPSVYVPISRIDPMAIPNAQEPLVQDLVKVLNDIILVINADGAAQRYDSTIAQAKSQLTGVGKRIQTLKDVEKDNAAKQVEKSQAEFDTAARELVRRLEQELQGQEGQWRREFDQERERLAMTFDERLAAEIEATRKIADASTQTRLLEQAIALKRDFTSAIQQRVEHERDGRLARLSDLSSSIAELEKLTNEWNSVLDANLKTQHLQVAVEAVRASLEQANRPRPFIRELATLKEVAANDLVVDSAIASISPAAYQLGVPTTAQLVDRFRLVANEVRKASLLPENAGVASHAASFLLSKVMFKKQGRAAGDDVESVLTRAETLLEEGLLDDAAREINTLQGWAKTLSRDWLNEVRKVLEVRQAIDVISTEARLQSLKVD